MTDLPVTSGPMDVLDMLYSVRMAFRRADMEVPAAIVLASHEDGMRLLAAIDATGAMIYTVPGATAKPVEHPDGSIWMEVQFAGMKIHWPANRFAIQAGGYVYG